MDQMYRDQISNSKSFGGGTLKLVESNSLSVILFITTVSIHMAETFTR